MGNSLSSDDFKCIGGEVWYKVGLQRRRACNGIGALLQEFPRYDNQQVVRRQARHRRRLPQQRVHSFLSRPEHSFVRESAQHLYALWERRHRADLDNIHNYALKSAAGVLLAEDTLGLETVHLQELSVIVNTTSSFEEFFIRRNALVIFLHRILRSAQINKASLRPALPGGSSLCTCKSLPMRVLTRSRNPHLEYCPLHDILDEEKKSARSSRDSRVGLFLPLQPGMRVQRGPDWQWADQDGGSGHQGTVMMVKEWKTQPNAAVRVKWDDKVNDNTYRYGGENCYDVIL